MCDLTLHPHEETLLDTKEAFIKNIKACFMRNSISSVSLGHGSVLLYMGFFCASPRAPGL